MVLKKRFEKGLFGPYMFKNCSFWTLFSFSHRLVNFKYFLMGEKAGESWVVVFWKEKKNVFKRLQNCSWKKYFFEKVKNGKILIFRFLPKYHLEVVLPTSKAKKWIFWNIWRILGWVKFFHRTKSFGSRGLWKFQFFFLNFVVLFLRI